MIVANWLTGDVQYQTDEDNLDKLDLSRLDLSFAYLMDVSLRGANLRGTNLQCAYLHGANLMGANLCGADLRIPESCLQEMWDEYGSGVYDARVCIKDEYLAKGRPEAGQMWVALTGVLLLAGLTGAIKGGIYDEGTLWPEVVGSAKEYARKCGARHIDWRWWRPWR